MEKDIVDLSDIYMPCAIFYKNSKEPGDSDSNYEHVFTNVFYVPRWHNKPVLSKDFWSFDRYEIRMVSRIVGSDISSIRRLLSDPGPITVSNMIHNLERRGVTITITIEREYWTPLRGYNAYEKSREKKRIYKSKEIL